MRVRNRGCAAMGAGCRCGRFILRCGVLPALLTKAHQRGTYLFAQRELLVILRVPGALPVFSGKRAHGSGQLGTGVEGFAIGDVVYLRSYARADSEKLNGYYFSFNNTLYEFKRFIRKFIVNFRFIL